MAPAYRKVIGNAAGGGLENYYVVGEHIHPATFIFQSYFINMPFFMTGCMRHSEAWSLVYVLLNFSVCFLFHIHETYMSYFPV
jgi:hypothetical protein